jgi:Zn-dependent M28 family amino/carboxypeptidase
MRAALVATLSLLLLALLAGCVQTKTASSSTGPLAAGSVVDDSAATRAAYVAPAQPKVDVPGLLADLKSFAAAYPLREDNAPTHEGARQWLNQTFASYGLQTFRQGFYASNIEQANLIGVKWGAVRDQVVVVGGHYDTTRNGKQADALTQGAYDDGSGTMMAVHLAKAWSDPAIVPYYTIAFVAYDGEEKGTQGAKAFVESVTEGNNPLGDITLHGALDIDMFGITWPGTNAPTQILDNSKALHKVFDDTRKAIAMPDDMAYCSDLATLGSSDFQEYFNAKVPTVFFSSDFGKVAPPGSPQPLPFFAYPFWHQVDTYDTMQAMAGGASQLEQGFTTAATFAAAELHALADTPTLALDVHAPPGGGAPVAPTSCA